MLRWWDDNSQVLQHGLRTVLRRQPLLLWRVVRDFNRCALPHSFRPAARGRRLRIRFAGGPGMGAHCELLLQIQTKLSMGKLAPKAASY